MSIKSKRPMIFLTLLCAAMLAVFTMPGVAQEEKMSDSALIEKAEETVLSQLILDHGIREFTEQSVLRDQTIDCAGGTMEVDEVRLRAANPLESMAVSVFFDRTSGEPVRLTADGDIYWQIDSLFRSADEKTVDKTAYIRDPRAGHYAVSLCSAADDYGLGKEMLLNGTEVTVHRILPTLGSYPHDIFEDPKEEWAYLKVGANEHFEGAQGYVPMVCLSFEKPDAKTAPVFTAAVTKDEATLYADTGLTDQALAQLKRGTKVRLLGRTMKYWHVEHEGMIGFVPAKDLALEEKAASMLPAFNRKNLITLQPGWEKREQAFRAKMNVLYNRNPPMGEWSVKQMAEGSRLAESYGMLDEWITDARGVPRIYIEPGKGDITEQEVVRLADKAAMDKYGFTEKDIKQRKVEFSYMQDQPEKKLWRVSYGLKLWQYDCSMTLDEKGKPVDFWQCKEAVGAYPHPRFTQEEAIKRAQRILVEKGYVPYWVLSGWSTRFAYEPKESELSLRVSFIPLEEKAYRQGLAVLLQDATGALLDIIDIQSGQSVMAENR